MHAALEQLPGIGAERLIDVPACYPVADGSWVCMLRRAGVLLTPLPHGPAEEHAARVKAEADASAAQRRFLVASQQMAEYLGQKADDTRVLASEAGSIHSAAAESGAAGAALAPRCSELAASLQAAAVDLDTTAGHFRTECEATKRSLSQVRLAYAFVGQLIVHGVQ